ncbi:MAG: rhodanese-like domain-containing protein [Pseudomonadota bacterium]
MRLLVLESGYDHIWIARCPLAYNFVFQMIPNAMQLDAIKASKFNFLLLLFIFLGGCDQHPKSTWSPGDAPASISASGEKVDTHRYIVADELLGRLESNEPPYVFDVRAKTSFAESRVEGSLSMPYGQFGEQELAAIKSLNKNSPIVTYCGCPHHLAGLAADQLIKMGYQQVRVLHEGYWYWRDNSFPIEGTETQALTHMKFAGDIPKSLYSDGNPIVFLKNQRNGQLEAAPIDNNGYFKIDFHVYGHQSGDNFELRLGSLGADVIDTIRSSDGNSSLIRIN